VLSFLPSARSNGLPLGWENSTEGGTAQQRELCRRMAEKFGETENELDT